MEYSTLKITLISDRPQSSFPEELFNPGAVQSSVTCIPCKKADEAGKANPDLILYDIAEIQSRGTILNAAGDLVRRFPAIPVVCIAASEGVLGSRELIRMGVWQVVDDPLNAAAVEKVLLGVMHHQRMCGSKASSYSEKNTILKTSLDILSHDTRNIFTNIQTILDEIGPQPGVKMLEESIQELKQTIFEAVGYLGSGKRIQSVIDILDSLLLTDKRINIRTHDRVSITNDNPLLLNIEGGALLKNAVLNVIENALKYTPQEHPVRVSITRNNDFIAVTVSDRGSGIPEDQKDRVFGRSVRLDSADTVEGTGRGLWITKNIVEKEGGSIHVEDNPEGGASFVILLPAFNMSEKGYTFEELAKWYNLSGDQIESKVQTMQTLIRMNGLDSEYHLDSLIFSNLLLHLRKDSVNRDSRRFRRRLRSYKNKNPDGIPVLVADDSLHVQYYLAAFLTEKGYRICEYAKNGQELVEYFKIHRPTLLTVDITMPRMSGIEAARHIFKLDDHVHIIFISGLGDSTLMTTQLKNQFSPERFSIIAKPFQEQELEQVLKGLADRS